MSDPLRETTQESAPSSLWLGADAPRRSVLADEVYEILKSKLMDNVVEPGSRLSIDGLALHDLLSHHADCGLGGIAATGDQSGEAHHQRQVDQ